MRKILLLTLLLTGCAGGDQLASVLSQPVDTIVQRQVQLARQLAAGGRVKFKGPVTFTIQTGTGNSSNITDATKAKAPVAAAPGAVATAATTGQPWKVYAVVVGLSLLLGAAGYYFLAPKLRL